MKKIGGGQAFTSLFPFNACTSDVASPFRIYKSTKEKLLREVNNVLCGTLMSSHVRHQRAAGSIDRSLTH